MADRHLKIGICLVLALLAAAPVHGQESTWGLRLFAHGGGMFPVRNLGKNAVQIEEEIEQESALQVIAELENSPSLGGGLEFLFPDHDIRIRGQIMTTVGATARGFLGLCETGGLAGANLQICALDLGIDARAINGSAELVLVAGEPDRWVRPVVSFGVGIRSFDFESDQLDCNRFGDEADDAYQVCERSREILVDPSVNPTLTFGVGFETERDPLSVFVRLNTVAGSYTGGTGLADGGLQVDLALNAGLAFRVR